MDLVDLVRVQYDSFTPTGAGHDLKTIFGGHYFRLQCNTETFISTNIDMNKLIIICKI